MHSEVLHTSSYSSLFLCHGVVVHTDSEEWGHFALIVYACFAPGICSSHTKLNSRDEFILEVNGYADFRTHKVASQQLASNAI